jgi:GNAT superfamily N-acetyltransferase
VEIGARVATDADLAEVTALCELGVAELRPLRGGAVWSQWEARPQPFGDSIRNTADDPASLIVVGTIDDTIVAYSAVSETTLHDGSQVGNLTDLYVMPDARGVGIGEAMMGAVTEWCRQRGCIGVDSIALPGDRATKNFFESFGMVARALRVHRAL